VSWEESVRHRLAALHELIAGYRELAYKLLIAHATLLAAVIYFVSENKALSSSELSTVRWAMIAVSIVFLWWLIVLMLRSDAHVDDAADLWSDLSIKMSRPATWRSGKRRPSWDWWKWLGWRRIPWGPFKWWTRTWWPVLAFPIVATIAVSWWLCDVQAKAASCPQASATPAGPAATPTPTASPSPVLTPAPTAPYPTPTLCPCPTASPQCLTPSSPTPRRPRPKPKGTSTPS